MAGNSFGPIREWLDGNPFDRLVNAVFDSSNPA